MKGKSEKIEIVVEEELFLSLEYNFCLLADVVGIKYNVWNQIQQRKRQNHIRVDEFIRLIRLDLGINREYLMIMGFFIYFTGNYKQNENNRNLSKT
ncbi:hypothetical protein GQX74_010701 [Glossina fuscipes]|nr:hypothetical protein GQX74_010701 [Glossina fuscipes]